jgi:predicted ribosome quality control (RQC) complex YloA/Tae2 family protein
MIKNKNFSDIPVDLRTTPWLERLLTLFQEQAQTIQEQGQVIQKQAEQITSLKQTVQALRDEVNRLKKLPKRPKFRPGGPPSDPKKSTEQGAHTSTQRTMRQRIKEEVLVKAVIER